MNKVSVNMTAASLGSVVSGHFENVATAAICGGIEAQESAEQAIFCVQNSLPRLMGGARAPLEAMGVTFGEFIDDQFIYATLPTGWKKIPTPHSMWSHLLDDKGRKRASIFFKAAFYDRSAHLRLESRFNVKPDLARQQEGFAVATVMDGYKVIFATDPVKLPARNDPGYDDIRNTAMNVATAWLAQQFPDWLDPAAYWD